MYTNIKQIHQHINMRERRDAVVLYKDVSDTKVPIVMDNTNNDACNYYSAMPDRLYIIQEGKIVYKGCVGPDDYKPQEIEEYLKIYELKQNGWLYRNIVVGLMLTLSTYVLFRNKK
eukprot:88026_1